MSRPRIILQILAAAVALLGLPGDAQGGPPPIARPHEFVDAVNRAIARGSAWLRHQEGADGWRAPSLGPAGAQGFPALVVLTLRVCGLPRSDPSIRRRLDALRAAYYAAAKGSESETYALAMMCMAVGERDRLADGATATRNDCFERVPAADLAWLQDMAVALERMQNPDGSWTYGATGSGAYDYSNTQYALLGLRSASQAGAKVHQETWSRALRHHLASQEVDGPSVPRLERPEKGTTAAAVIDRSRGWGYRAAGPAYGSMTAGAVASVVLCRSGLLGTRGRGLGAVDDRAERALRDGIAWLGRHFTVETNPGPERTGAGVGWTYYYLYALERAGVLAGVDWMNGHDWYGEGARFLVGAQFDSGAWAIGSWAPGQPDVGNDLERGQSGLSTCWALLFLKRGTAPVARGALTASADETEINFGVVPSLGDADFGDFVDLVLSRFKRMRDGQDKEQLLSRTIAIGPRIVPSLILRLASRDLGDRSAALALLERATGLDHGFKADAPATERDSSIERWSAWWFAHRETLRSDAASGRWVAK